MSEFDQGHFEDISEKMGVPYIQATGHFDNGWGYSVVRGVGTYGYEHGLYELAVLDRHGNLSYDTPVTDDVLGYLTEEAVMNNLRLIAALPEAPQ